jgi:glycerophosphoryl diester phosphodiesterase
MTQAPENTLAAFRLAIEQGAEGIELDARLTADGEVVVFHDESLERVTDGHGRVRNYTLAELKRLDAGERFNPAFRGERIPTLREVFDELDRSARFDIELTDYTDPFGPLAGRVLCLVREYRLEERVVITSFNPIALLKTRRMDPEVVCGIIALRGSKGALQRSWIGRLFARHLVVSYYTDIREDFVRREHKRERKVVPWTANTSEDIQRLAGWAVDGIITDRPDLAVQVLRSA